jgi:acyl-CoA synthetase (AMP-forming)/AMP-acid ligase II
LIIGPSRLAARARLLVDRSLTLGDLFDRTAAGRGGATLVDEADGLHLDHLEAAARVDALAGAVAARVDARDRVVVATPNSFDQLLLSLAVMRAGAIAVPVNDQMTEAEVDGVIDDAGAALVVRSIDDMEIDRSLGENRAVDATDTAALFYTSGTTGRPKGAELTHRSLVGQVAAGSLWPGGLRRDEVLVSLPVAHIMGFVALLATAVAGLPVHFRPRFRPDEVLDAIESRRCAIFIGVPAMYRMLEEAGAADRDLTSVRVWASGADTMPSDLARRFKSYGASATLPVVGPIGEAVFAEGYGMVEMGGGVATKISPPYMGVGLGDSLGVPSPRHTFRVVDDDGNEVGPGREGELLVRGPGVLRSYWGAPDATAEVMTEDGWLRTGDLARRGPFGTAMFAGRKKDVILTGGYTVYPPEIEAAIEEHPDVAEAAVVGLPDDRDGEVPVAAVRAVPGSEPEPDELLAWTADRLAAYKAPRRIVVTDTLPRTGTRKVKRQELLPLFA